MDRTGNIAALSLTFAAGVAAGSILVAQIMARYLSPGGLYAILTCLFIVTLTILTAARLSRRGGLWKILILFLFTGIFCAVCSFVSGIGAGTAGSGGIAAGCADNVRSMLDSIPFPSPRTSPLLKALLTGDKSGLDSHTVATFRDSGAAHILALSGLHLGFIYAILLKVTSLAGMSPRVRKIRSILIIAVSGFYTIATGASPSLVRAFLFIVINETARLLHRHVPPVHVLCIALMIQLALTPAVISSIGFQMSYLAMAGIFLIYPHLKAWYPGRESGIDLPRKIWNTAALTLSCQILTGPLAWLRFRTFPLYFLITNLFALPVTSLLMLLAICTTALAYIGFCPNLLVTATDYAASALLFIMEVIAGL